jgi:single-stranded-DNA-specific exonuclease
MPDMRAVLALLQQAKDAAWSITIFGDYDVDGVTSTVLLEQVLKGLGLTVDTYIPDRQEGYGLTIEAINVIAKRSQLLITVDCGISSAVEVAHARQRGLQVIVTDHHTLPEELPDCLILNGKIAPYPDPDLVGCGVVYKLVQALQQAGWPVPFKRNELLDLVALATIVDVGQLVGENRVFVRHGLNALSNSIRPGLVVLRELLNLHEPLTVSNVGFVLGPVLNAAGRMAHASLSADLLRAATEDAALPQAQQLIALNQERKALTQQYLDLLRPILRTEHQVIISTTECPDGLLGLVASRLMDLTGKPVFLMHQSSQDRFRGSARSPGGMSIVATLAQCADLLFSYGGHIAAGGFALHPAQVDAFKARLRKLGSTVQPRALLIDSVIPITACTWAFYMQLQELAPFGAGFDQPVFGSFHVSVDEVRPSRDGRHLFFDVGGVEAVYFHVPEEDLRRLLPATHVHMAYTLEQSIYEGRRKLQLLIRDMHALQNPLEVPS